MLAHGREERVEAGTRGCIMYEFILVARAKIRDKVLRHSGRINLDKDKYFLQYRSFPTKRTTSDHEMNSVIEIFKRTVKSRSRNPEIKHLIEKRGGVRSLVLMVTRT